MDLKALVTVSKSNTHIRTCITHTHVHTQPSKPMHGDIDDSSVLTTAMTGVKLIPLELLKCEEAFYWRCLCHYLHSKGDKGDEYLESIVPTLTEMCDYIERC